MRPFPPAFLPGSFPYLSPFGLNPGLPFPPPNFLPPMPFMIALPFLNYLSIFLPPACFFCFFLLSFI